MNEFESLVKKMREAQRNYFATNRANAEKKSHWLSESKRLERLVDEWIHNKENGVQKLGL